MHTWNYWKEFESTGKIEDYLSYKASYSQRPEEEEVAGCKSDYQETFSGIPENGAAERRGMDGSICRNSYR